MREIDFHRKLPEFVWFYKVKQVLRDFREVEGYVHVLMYMTTWGHVHVRYRSVEARCPHPVFFLSHSTSYLLL